MTDYIHIRNWDRFQHADVTKRGRAPIWIKLYTELHSDEAFLSLTGHRRAILIGLWIEYARTRGRVPHDMRSLARRLQLRVANTDIDALADAGFLDTRSTPARHALDTGSTKGQPTNDTATAQAKPLNHAETDRFRQDNVTPPSSLEERREEKTRAVTYIEDQRAKHEAQGPGENDFTNLLKEMPA